MRSAKRSESIWSLKKVGSIHVWRRPDRKNEVLLFGHEPERRRFGFGPDLSAAKNRHVFRFRRITLHASAVMVTKLIYSYFFKCPPRLWSWDSNPRPSEHESHPITTRPGLPPIFIVKLSPDFPIKTDYNINFCSDLLSLRRPEKMLLHFKPLAHVSSLSQPTRFSPTRSPDSSA